jgi:hypothetical protein
MSDKTPGNTYIGPNCAGKPVRELQGVVDVKPSGKYGQDTYQAVTHYQKKHGLRSAGYVESTTLKAIQTDNRGKCNYLRGTSITPKLVHIHVYKANPKDDEAGETAGLVADEWVNALQDPGVVRCNFAVRNVGEMVSEVRRVMSRFPQARLGTLIIAGHSYIGEPSQFIGGDYLTRRRGRLELWRPDTLRPPLVLLANIARLSQLATLRRYWASDGVLELHGCRTGGHPTADELRRRTREAVFNGGRGGLREVDRWRREVYATSKPSREFLRSVQKLTGAPRVEAGAFNQKANLWGLDGPVLSCNVNMKSCSFKLRLTEYLAKPFSTRGGMTRW